MTIRNDINLNLLKRKKSSKSNIINKNFLVKKKLIRINLIKKISKVDGKFIIRFSFYENQIKLKKISDEFKYFNK
jgi:hypothetical protein